MGSEIMRSSGGLAPLGGFRDWKAGREIDRYVRSGDLEAIKEGIDRARKVRAAEMDAAAAAHVASNVRRVGNELGNDFAHARHGQSPQAQEFIDELWDAVKPALIRIATGQ